MIDRSDPIEINAISMAALKRRSAYVENEMHKNHAGKGVVVLEARNYNCADQSREVFLERVKETHCSYLNYRAGRQSEPIDRLWEELIYSTLPEAYLIKEERDRIEQMIIEKFGPTAVIRTAWHISPNGRADLHILMSSTAPAKDDPDEYEVLFGRRVGNAIAAYQSTDRKIARYLNANPNKHITHIAAIDAHIAQNRSLAEKIAERWPDERIGPENIADVLTRLGHKVIEVTKKSITLIYKGAVSQVTRVLGELLRAILKAQVRLKRQKIIECREAFLEPVADSKAGLLPPDTPKLEAPSAREPEASRASKAEAKFHKLKAYFEAANGHVHVQPSELYRLKRAVKSMLKPNGKVKPLILQEFSEHQSAIINRFVSEHEDHA